MDLLTERRLRYVLALRCVGEATLLRDSDKIPKLMNFHRRSDTPLGPPVCLRLARLGAVAKGVRTAVHSGRGTKRGLCGTITLVNELAVWFTPHEQCLRYSSRFAKISQRSGRRSIRSGMWRFSPG